MAKSQRWLSPGMPFVDITIGSTNINAIPNFLERFEVEVYADGRFSKTTISLYDPSWDTLENLVLANHEDIRYQYGWVDGRRSSVRIGTLLRYTPTFEHTGLRLQLELTDQAIIDQECVYSRSWKNAKVSDIVKDIYSGPKWDLDVEETSNTVSIAQKNWTNAFFVNHYLKPIAVSAATGRTGYEFRVEGDRVVFRTPNYDQGAIRRYVFGSTRDSRMISFSPSFDGMIMLQSGGGEVLAQGYDPMSKQPIEKKVNLNGAGPRIAQGDTTPDLDECNGLTGRHISLPFSDKASVDAWARDKFTRARSVTYQADAQIVGDPTLRVNDLVEVIVQKSDGGIHYTSGIYRITKVLHSIGIGEFTTTLTMFTDGSRNPKHEPNKGIKRDVPLIEEGESDRDPGSEVISE